MTAMDLWTGDDYVKLIEQSKKHKKDQSLDIDDTEERKTCPECKRPVANLFDEGIHNTGECGCTSSRSLCWRSWNGNKCVPVSPYDRSSST